MTYFFNKLFNIRTGEWPRILLLYLTFVLFVVGIVWGRTILYASFLAEIGVERLPWFLMVQALLAVPAVALYTAFADRVRNDRLLIGIFLLSAGAMVPGVLLLAAGLGRIAYPYLYLIIFVPLQDILGAHWYTYINGFYDTRAAKRIIPVLGTAQGVASIAAGLTLPLLNRLFAPHNVIAIVLLLMGLLTASAALTALTPRLLKETAGPAGHSPTLKAKGASFLHNIGEGYRYVAGSTFLRRLALSTLLWTVLYTFLEYFIGRILQTELATTGAISEFTALITAVSYTLILPIQLFLLSRIIGRLGLGNANLIFPAGNLLAAVTLVAAPGRPAAALAYAGKGDFYNAVGYQIDSLLYNAVPLRVKGRARAFIGGVVVPMGALAGSLLLLTPPAASQGFLRLAVAGLALAFLATALVIRRQYRRAMIHLLEQEDYSFLLAQETGEMSIADPAMLKKLAQRLQAAGSPEQKIFLLKLISDSGGAAAVPILAAAADSGEAHIRAAVLDILAASGARDRAVHALFIRLLDDPDPQVRQSAVDGLEQLQGGSRAFQQQVAPLLSDPDMGVRIRVLPALLGASDASLRRAARARLAEILEAPDVPARARGVRILGQLGEEEAARRLISYLGAPEDELRLEAAVALEALSGDGIPPSLAPAVAASMAERQQDPVERVRQAALLVMARLGGSKHYPALVDALTDPSPEVRATAADVVVQAGKAIIPTVESRLQSPDRRQRKMAAVILSRINVRQFGLLIKSHVTDNLLAVFRNYSYLEALAPLPASGGLGLLQRALAEANRELLDEIFTLLAAGQNSDAVALIQQSLAGTNERTRANALEALEALTSPQTAHLIAHLVAPEPDRTEILRLARETWELEPPSAGEALRLIVADRTGDPWLRAVAVYVAGRIGAAFQPQARPAPPVGARPAPPPEAASQEAEGDRQEREAEEPAQKRRARRRRAAADLLGALSGDEPAEAGPPAPASASELTTLYYPPPALRAHFNLPELLSILQAAGRDPEEPVRLVAQEAEAMLAGRPAAGTETRGGTMLSIIERIIFLKEVLFFRGMTIDQLKVLAAVCEEEFFAEDAPIYKEGDPGGTLYVVVYGRVAIERQGRRKGSFARLATVEANASFGEMNLFNDSPHDASATAVQDTLTLRLRREPLMALMRRHPNLSLEIIYVLSQRLREATAQIADLSRTMPRELHKLFDQLN